MATNNIPHERVYIAMKHQSGRISTMEMFTRMTVGSLGLAFDGLRGFKLSDDGLFWERPASDENIQEEILTTQASSPMQDVIASDGPIVGWHVVPIGDIPQERSYFLARRDDGSQITHDAGKVKAIYLENHRIEAEQAAIEADKQRLMASYVAPDVSKLDVAATVGAAAVAEK